MIYQQLWTAMAVLYVERFGFSVIPMTVDKKPQGKWGLYQDRHPTIQDILSWKPENLAIVTGAISKIVVVDCESREDAEWFWRVKGQTPTVVQTRRGFHFYFKHPSQRVRNGQKIYDRYDVRGDGGYVLAPPSRFPGGSYIWKTPLIHPEKLPSFDTAWRPDTTDGGVGRAIADGAKYINSIRAVSGQGGHNDTYRAVHCLRKAGFTELDALVAIQRWNRTNAEPPWSDAELLHKVRDAYQ